MTDKRQIKTGFTKEIKYLLYTPKSYDETKPSPLLIFLHGAGERGNDLELVKIHGPPKLIEAGVELPMIVASPQVALNEWWSPSTVVWLLKDIQSRLNIDPKRVYLTGLSMGGYGTWETAIRYPTLFAAIVPICGRGDPTMAERIKHIPTWIFHGAKDDVVPMKYSEGDVRGTETVWERGFHGVPR
ncbi:MAG: carboxylesterase family protein, partial [bacterium]